MDIMGIVLGGVSLLLGVSVVWGRVEKVLAALRELSEVFTVIVRSLDDKKLTEEELTQIKKEAREAIAAFKAVVK